MEAVEEAAVSGPVGSDMWVPDAPRVRFGSKGSRRVMFAFGVLPAPSSGLGVFVILLSVSVSVVGDDSCMAVAVGCCLDGFQGCTVVVNGSLEAGRGDHCCPPVAVGLAVGNFAAFCSCRLTVVSVFGGPEASAREKTGCSTLVSWAVPGEIW